MNNKSIQKVNMKFVHAELPYELNSLEPYISEETVKYHYGKHHKTYVDNLNQLIINTEFENNANLIDIILNSKGSLFNNASQVWNHNFYWNCIEPNNKDKPDGKILKLINKYFNNFDNFKNKFSYSAKTHFGSGWTWLIENTDNSIEIINTNNADNPLKYQTKPLLVIDVWEHAYYIDMKNDRAKYIEAWWNLVNWENINKSL